MPVPRSDPTPLFDKGVRPDKAKDPGGFGKLAQRCGRCVRTRPAALCRCVRSLSSPCHCARGSGARPLPCALLLLACFCSRAAKSSRGSQCVLAAGKHPGFTERVLGFRRDREDTLKFISACRVCCVRGWGLGARCRGQRQLDAALCQAQARHPLPANARERKKNVQRTACR